MKKIAVFVEGQTELIFMKELITQVVGTRGLVISSGKFMGGNKSPRMLTELKISTPDNTTQYYFMIYDCATDNRVKTDIIDQLQSLQNASFTNIIGIRDVYPDDIAKVKKYLFYGIPKSSIKISIILAVNETEAWFLAEDMHYNKIDPKLTLDIANCEAKIDLKIASTETIPHPAEILNNIYQHVGKAYHKDKKQVQRTVNKLDYANLYMGVRMRNNSLNELLTSIEGVL